MRKTRILTALIVLSLGVLAPLTEAQRLEKKSNETAQKTPTDNAKQELKALYEKLLFASRTRDETMLRKILTEDYSQVTADGRVRTKAIRIEETMSQDNQNELLNLESFDVFFYRDSAVARCLVRKKGTVKGEAYDLKILSTATFVKEGKVWRIAATHLSLVK